MSKPVTPGQRQLTALLNKLTSLEAGEEDFSLRTTYTYLLGVYLAVNAIEDAFLLVEGPDCAYMKAQYIQGNHDWLSTLTSVSGTHRLANTALHPAMMTDSREQPLIEMMERIASHEAPAALLLTSMPMAFVTGADHERLCRQVGEASGKDVLYVPGLSLSGDWIDGYAQTLNSLARQLDLSGGDPRPDRVGIIGNLFDRNEADHTANVRILTEMCQAAGLDVASIWLSGQDWAALGEVRQAGTLIALPYGRKAAKSIARQTGAQVIDLPLPFGPTACENWMRVLGGLGGAEAAAQEYVDRKMGHIAPRLEWLIPFQFQNLEVGYVGDPHLLPGFMDILTLLGARLHLISITNRPAHARQLAGEDLDTEPLIWPQLKSLIRYVVGQVLEHDIRLLVSNNTCMSLPLPDTAMVEFGFPSVFLHALYERPFLGFDGFLAFVDTLANALRQKELEQFRASMLDAGG